MNKKQSDTLYNFMIAIQDMNRQTDCQKLLDLSVAHIRKQGKPSYSLTEDNVIDSCEYRSEKGLMCAAGIFINPSFDIRNSNLNWSEWLLLAHHIPNPQENIIYPEAIREKQFVVTVLQDAHDNAALNHIDSFLENYHSRLTHSIAKWNLDNNMSLVIPE